MVSEEETPSSAFATILGQIRTVREQIDLLDATYTELMTTADECMDKDDEEAAMEMLVAAIGGVAIALRVLAQNLEWGMNERQG